MAQAVPDRHLISNEDQREIAKRIDAAISKVLLELHNHGTEEGITPVLGHALMQQSFTSPTFSVQFNYRQLHKQVEEPAVGADGGFLVRIRTPDSFVTKGALFQAKYLKNSGPVRGLTIAAREAARLKQQCTDMLNVTKESIAMFYTPNGVYVVDAKHYRDDAVQEARQPLGERRRLISLGTYLGKWMPRCTRGDLREDFVGRVERVQAFRHSLTVNVNSGLPSITWGEQPVFDQLRPAN